MVLIGPCFSQCHFIFFPILLQIGVCCDDTICSKWCRTFGEVASDFIKHQKKQRTAIVLDKKQEKLLVNGRMVGRMIVKKGNDIKGKSKTMQKQTLLTSELIPCVGERVIFASQL